MRLQQKLGFTLIELLIVVAIIAILAAIAVPNFLEAQTRAKVSRAKSDMRTIAVGLEAYIMDTNKFPTDAGNGSGGGTRRPYPPGNVPTANYSLGYEITTPVAYLTNVAGLYDVFKEARKDVYTGSIQGREVYNFVCWGHRNVRDTDAARKARYGYHIDRDGYYVISSAGPDRFFFNANGGVDLSFNVARTAPDGGPVFAWPPAVSYDPTNGTVSHGDIYRTQKYGDGIKQELAE